MKKLIRINDNDNVAVALCDLESGYNEDGLTLKENIKKAHKTALFDMKKGERVIKYGYPIGTLTSDVKAGEHIHSHNLKTNLDEEYIYTFSGDNSYEPRLSDIKLNAFKRANGEIGIRNEIRIIPTVGCVNKTCELIERACKKLEGEYCDAVVSFSHPFGCSQMDEDLITTQKILSALVKHPNAGGVLIVSLGCENNNLDEFKKVLAQYDEKRVKFLVCQEEDDEIEKGVSLVNALFENMKNDKREEVGLEKLVVGFKCGGSDAFSGITANALCGRVNDILTDAGAKTILTEVPEMFGAEDILLKRCLNKEVFDKAEKMLLSFKSYFAEHGKVCYENPSPGNREGGITTLEEKSLGCVQKGGNAVITDVLALGETCKKSGLNLLWGPGNDIVSTTNLACSGAHIILFTTGRGTPLGASVPTIKIASNSALAERKAAWIDLDGQTADKEALFKLIIETANGKKTKNEINAYRDISIFKDGVTM
ncbi:MAG: altronate dehydratase [Eubacterium sp.]|nr:altronate dehydratase [Eubacterium sp.]